MKQLTIKDFSNAYEFKQAKKQAIKQCNALKYERKNKRIFIKQEFNMIVDTKTKQIEVAAAFIDAPFEVIDDKIRCGINLSIKDKNFVCIVEKTDEFKLVDFTSDIKTYLSGFYDIKEFGDVDDRYTQDYFDEAIDYDLSRIRQLVIDKAKEVINSYLQSK